MKNCFLLLAFILNLSTSPSLAQVYLILASAPPLGVPGTDPSSLARVNSDGSVQSILEIVPSDGALDKGTAQVLVSHDARKAIFISGLLDNRVFALDFDRASVVKTCPLPKVSGSLPFQKWLTQRPGNGLVLGLHYATRIPVGAASKVDGETILGMNLDPTVPCGDSFLPLDREDFKYVRRHGYAGVGDFGGDDHLDLPIAPDGSVKMIWFNGQQTFFPYPIPPDLVNGTKNPAARLLVDNPQVFVASIFEVNSPGSSPSASGGHSRVIIFRKSDQTWHRLPESIPASSIRGFGRFLAMAETQPKTATIQASAGASEWKEREDDETHNGPGVIGRMIKLKHVYPGVLRVYDIANDKTYSIQTNQGDSEILLAENDVIYYRVYTRLYSVPIQGDKLGQSQLLATSDLLPDAHWAFIKH